MWFDVNSDSHVRLESRTFEGCADFDVDQPSQVREHHWGDYARGAKYALRKRFELKRGINGILQGSLPIGGLSSCGGKGWILLNALLLDQRGNPENGHGAHDGSA